MEILSTSYYIYCYHITMRDALIGRLAHLHKFSLEVFFRINSHGFLPQGFPYVPHEPELEVEGALRFY